MKGNQRAMGQIRRQQARIALGNYSNRDYRT